MSITTPSRDGNLDLLRAIAVLSVVLYHLLQWSPVDPEWIDNIAHYGSYGVDLFFILSGFLIGSIYWREERASGRVRLMRFLQRRWLRTIPPYLGALLLSWLAVRFARGEAFDWRYFLFAQNYATVMPYFQVSWSLCVEEHFYLLVPLAMSLTRTFRPIRPLLLAIGAIGPLLFRWDYAPIGAYAPFGSYRTATHLHFEGLSIGFALAWLNACRPDWWERAHRLGLWTIVPCAILCWVAATSGRANAYIWLTSAIALLFAAILLAVAGRRAIAGGVVARPVRAIAITSYSVYLVHPLMIHVGNVVNAKIGFIGDRLTLFVVWPLLIAGFGFAFYFVVERGALALRDLWAPSDFSGGGLEHPLGTPLGEHPIAAEISHDEAGTPA